LTGFGRDRDRKATASESFATQRDVEWNPARFERPKPLDGRLPVPYERRTVKRTSGPVVRSVVLGAAALATLAVPASAFAQAKPKVTRACGVSALPLTVGNQWTYEPVGAPPELQLSPSAARLAPAQPKKITIQVTSVETQGDVTIVTLSEDIGFRTLNTTIKCGATKFEVDPNSFFFAAEPGGAWGVNLTPIERKGNTLELKGGKLAGPEWRDDLIATWEQVPTPGSGATLGKGKLETERAFKVLSDATLVVPAGKFSGREVTVDITGRVTLDPPAEKPFEMPANFRSHFWFADGVGLVQSVNGYAQMFVLTSVKITK
jgi:hypothetical protein